MNIVTIKLGNKFDSSFVNRVYEMCKRNLTQDFKFFCYTDDMSGIHPDIHIIAHQEMNLRPYFYKLYMLELFDEAVLLDLDVVIQNNIDWLSYYFVDNKITLIKTDYRRYNSSVMAWKNAYHIWYQFMINPKKHMDQFRGIDGFLSTLHRGCLRNFLKWSIYSRIYGIYEFDKEHHIKGTDRHKEYYYPEMSICIFNSYNREIILEEGYLLDDKSYEGMEHYWS